MKSKYFLILVLALASCSSSPNTETVSASPKAKIDQPTPPFQLQSIDGKTVQLSDFKGSVLLLDFWATWCPPCRLSTPALVQLNQKYSGKNFKVIGISLDENREAVSPFVKSEKVQHTILYANSQIQENYQIRAIPSFFLIDKEGLIRRRYDGFYPGLQKEWEKDIESLLNPR